jgi:hypothetical protein
VEGDAQQATLVEGPRAEDPERHQARADVQEQRLGAGGEVDRPQLPDLVDDIETSGLPWREDALRLSRFP